MNSYTFHDILVEKANAISRYRRVQRVTALFRLLELLVFVIAISRFSSQLAFSVKVSGECFRGIAVTLITPRFVFLLGNAIVIVLFLRSRRFSAKSGGDRIAADFYDEYAEKCRTNHHHHHQQRLIQHGESEGKKAIGASRNGACRGERKVIRSRSENLDRERRRRGEERERRLDLRRSVTDVRRRSPECRRALAAPPPAAAEVENRSACAEDEMSGEEFRRTVEAFIARQQKFLREE